jgi:hypothetical protein
LADFQIRPRFHVEAGGDRPLNSLDLGVLDRRRDTTSPDHSEDARGHEKGQTLVRVKATEHIPRE